MTDEQRAESQEHIAAGEPRQHSRGQLPAAEELQREGDEESGEEHALVTRAKETGGQMADFAREHPFALIAGGIALGIAVSALFPNSPTRKLGRKAGSQLAQAGRHAGETLGETRQKAGARASALTAFATQLAMTFGQHVLESFDTAREAGKEKLDEAGSAVSVARDAALKTARQASKAIADRTRRGD